MRQSLALLALATLVVGCSAPISSDILAPFEKGRQVLGTHIGSVGGDGLTTSVAGVRLGVMTGHQDLFKGSIWEVGLDLESYRAEMTAGATDAATALMGYVRYYLPTGWDRYRLWGELGSGWIDNSGAVSFSAGVTRMLSEAWSLELSAGATSGTVDIGGPVSIDGGQVELGLNWYF